MGRLRGSRRAPRLPARWLEPGWPAWSVPAGRLARVPRELHFRPAGWLVMVMRPTRTAPPTFRLAGLTPGKPTGPPACWRNRPPGRYPGGEREGDFAWGARLPKSDQENFVHKKLDKALHVHYTGTVDEHEFQKWPSIPRLRASFYCTVTEKIDGTNAQVLITNDGEVQAGSRKRWITPEDDNFGFAAWVEENKTDLLEDLGPGRHFGEWWGEGIQRRYGVEGRTFSLFNVGRWGPREPYFKICKVVPVLYKGPYSKEAVEEAKDVLRLTGSKVAPGFMEPEGIVVQMGDNLAKWTFGGDGHKGEA